MTGTSPLSALNVDLMPEFCGNYVADTSLSISEVPLGHSESLDPGVDTYTPFVYSAVLNDTGRAGGISVCHLMLTIDNLTYFVHQSGKPDQTSERHLTHRKRSQVGRIRNHGDRSYEKRKEIREGHSRVTSKVLRAGT